MAKYGSARAWLFVDGYDMSVNKLQGLSYKLTSITEPTHGIGDSWEEHTPVGLSRAELSQEGAFFNSSTSGGFLHVLNSTSIGGQGPSSTPKIVCLGVAGLTAGQAFVGFEGEYQQDYEVLAQTGKLTRANATYVVTGNADHGIIVSTGTTSGIDNGVATTAGGTAYLQISSIDMATSTGVTIGVVDSSDGITYASLATFVSSGNVGGQRLEVAGTVERYLSRLSPLWSSGAGTITYFVGFSRI